MESFSPESYSKWDDDHVWSSQEWKTDTEMYERPGRPDVTSWGATREVRPGFSHEVILHDGRNEETPREGSGQPDIDSQEEAWLQQFVIGNDEAELEMSVESRSFARENGTSGTLCLEASGKRPSCTRVSQHSQRSTMTSTVETRKATTAPARMATCHRPLSAPVSTSTQKYGVAIRMAQSSTSLNLGCS